jgi:hypothetical protein
MGRRSQLVMKALKASSFQPSYAYPTVPLRCTSVSPNRVLLYSEDYHVVITTNSAVNRMASGLAGPTVEGELRELDGGIMGPMRGIFSVAPCS